MSTKVTGKRPLAYTGVEAPSPPNLRIINRAPTIHDCANFNIGDEWIDSSSTPAHDVWMLVKKHGGIATWIKFVSGTGLIVGLRAEDTNIAYPLNHIINVAGDGILLNTTAAVANTVTMNVTDGTDVELIIGGGGAGAAWGELTSTGGTIAIAAGAVPNTINLEATGLAGLVQLGTDVGIATPTAGQIDILGGTNINTDISGPGPSDVIINLNDNVDIPGTFTVSSFGRGVVQADAAGLLSSEGTDGQVLIGSSTGAPAWSNVTAGAGITVTNGANSIQISETGGHVMTCAFSAYLGANVNNVTGNDTVYKIICDVELFDVGNNYNNATGLFSAPVTGYYLFKALVEFRNMVAGFRDCEMWFSVGPPPTGTPAVRQYWHQNINPQPIVDHSPGAAHEYDGELVDIIHLTIGQVVSLHCKVGDYTKTVGLTGRPGIQIRTNFGCYLIGT